VGCLEYPEHVASGYVFGRKRSTQRMVSLIFTGK
jgi:hypothetical protein